MTNDFDRSSYADRHYHFVTGRLAESIVRDVVERVASKLQFEFSIGVMPITVAALMTPKWLLRHLDVPHQATHVVLPGYFQETHKIAEKIGLPVLCGPRDARDLPEFFGLDGAVTQPDLANFDIEIIAEINHAPRMSLKDFLQHAQALVDDGADRIDVGCEPGYHWKEVGEYVTALIDQGLQVSIDSFDPKEVQKACDAGASLVLSVNASNRKAAPDWGAEVVVIPDDVDEKKSFHETIFFLSKHQVSMRLDPILEPIGVGVSKSIVRYFDTRRDFPDLPMMMGIGNVTELSDVDSAGLNLLLLGICQELQIQSVLTTQVINWARSCVRECDLARRMVHYAVRQQVPPKRISDGLVMLRDRKLKPFSSEMLLALAEQLKENNYRLFAQEENIHLVASQLHLQSEDPFQLFADLMDQPQSANVDAPHAFYLGFEMAKALTALQLGKEYRQDQALDWGILTVPEQLHRLSRSRRRTNGENR